MPKIRQAFTLVEILVTIGILAVLATATTLVINPAEYLSRSRDSVRISDIDTLNKSLGLFRTQGGSFTPADIVYISLPAPNQDCTGVTPAYVLPALPAGWAYKCATSDNLRKIDGSGWVPLDLTSAPPSPLGKLPVDPINSDANQQYYTYIGGSWSLSARMESSKFLKDTNLSDGGSDPVRYEAASDPMLWSEASGLAGYWKMDEASGGSVNDSSPNGINASVNGSITRRSGSECIIGGCIETTTNGNYVRIPYDTRLNLTTNVTYTNWVKIKTAIGSSTWPQSLGSGDSHRYYAWRSTSNGTSWMFEYGSNNPTCDGTTWTSMGGINLGTDTWHHLAATYDGSTIRTYLDGVQVNSRSFTAGFCSNSSAFYYLANSPSTSVGVYVVDEARIYNRALTASEIASAYNAGR